MVNGRTGIGEKQVFVVAGVFDPFRQAMERAGSKFIDDGALARLADVAGVRVAAGTEMLHAVTDLEHPFVMDEQKMPCLLIVRVRTMEEAIEKAKISEHGYKHSAMIHTRDVNHMTAMGKALDSTLFVKNGPCIAGLGMGGEGYGSFSIATTTGEGITTPISFSRRRRAAFWQPTEDLGRKSRG